MAQPPRNFGQFPTITSGAASRLDKLLMWQSSAEDNYATTYAQVMGDLDRLRGVINALDPQFNVTGDGSANDTAGLQAALTAAEGQTLHLPPLTYRIAAELTVPDDIVILGYGATLRSSTRIRSYLGVVGRDNVTIRGLGLDLDQANQATYTEADYPSWYQVGVYAESSSDVTVEECEFTNLYTQGIVLYQCSGFAHLRRNRHISGAQTQAVRAEHIYVQSSSCDVVVEDCRFPNERPTSAGYGVPAFLASGTTGRVVFQRNRGAYCGRNATEGVHQLGAISFYGDDEKVQVKDNVFTDCLERVARLTTSHHGEVSGNHFSMSDLAVDGDQMMVSLEGTTAFLPTGLAGITDMKIHDNTFEDAHGTQRVGVYVGGYDYAYPSTSVWVTKNDFIGMKDDVQVAGPYRGVFVEQNHTTSANGGRIVVTQAPGGVPVTADEGVTEAEGAYHDLVIRGNTHDLEVTDASVISLDFTKSPDFTGTIGDITIDDNTIRFDGANAAPAVVIRGVAGKGRYFVRKNKVTNVTYALDVANAAEVEVEDNRGANLATGTVLDSGGVTLLVQRGNRWTTGAVNGRAVLVAGTVTVTTAEVRAGDNITLTRVVTGGTVGHLSVGTIVAGTSFVIDSSSATDTSTIYWEIRH